MRLASHAEMEFLTPAGNWDRISDDPWFGAAQAGSMTNTQYNGTWPHGFYVFAFDYNGTCTADGMQRSNVGASSTSLFSSSDTHARFIVAADKGGGWVQYTGDDGAERLAQIVKTTKSGRTLYLGVAFTKRWATWAPDCTSTLNEPCSENNAQAIVGAANSDIIAAKDHPSLQEVLRMVATRSGPYNTSVVGDFSVHVYSIELQCVDFAASAGRPCPPSLTQDEVGALNAVSKKEDASWTRLSSSQEFGGYALVFRTVWSPAGSVGSQEFLIVSFVGEPPAPPRCGPAVLARDATSVQILAMSAFLLAFSLLQLTKQPWRSKIANLMDGGLVQMMVLLLLCVAMSTNLDGSDSVIGTLGAIVFGTLFICVTLVGIHGVHSRLMPAPYFQRFICHHKADAAAQVGSVEDSTEVCAI